MKTQETKSAQMDDIVFENRNKSYGAYILRKTYNKQLNRALLIATAILIAGLAYPIVSSYHALNTGINILADPGIIFTTPPDEKEAVPLTPPPPPPPISETEARTRFVAPDVTTDDVFTDEDVLNQDRANQNYSSTPIAQNVDPDIEKEPDVINEPSVDKETFTIVEEMPSFTGGDTERLKFLSENMIYPSQAADNGIQGTVYVQFIIDSKGNITDANVIRGIGGGCDEEALRVVKSMPQWHPGKQNGRTVRVQFTMPIIFKLQG